MKNLLINGMAHRSHLYHYDILNHKSNYDQFVANNHQCDPKSLQTLYQQSFDCIVSSFFSFSFLQGLQSSLLRPSWQNTHPAVQSGASNVLLRNFSKIIPFHRILQRHVHTQQHSKEDPLHDVYPAPDRLEPIDTQMRMWMSCTSCSIRTDSTQSTPQRSTTRSVRICSPKTTTSPLCPAPTPRIPLPTQVQFLFMSEVCRHHQRHQHRQQYILRWLLHLQQGDDTQ